MMNNKNINKSCSCEHSKFVLIFVISLILILSNLFLTNIVHADNNNNNNDSNNNIFGIFDESDYYIQSMNVTVNVKEDNTISISQDVNFYFNRPTDKFYVSIPLINEINDKNSNENRLIKAKVKNIKSNLFSSGDEKSDAEVVKYYGNKNHYKYKGDVNFKLSYNLIFDKDEFNNKDELNLNLIGNYDCPIKNITWTINMPKDFDESKINYTSFLPIPYGSNKLDNDYNLNNDIIENNFDNNLIESNVFGKEDDSLNVFIKGKYNGILNKNENISINLYLYEGYFIYKTNLEKILDFNNKNNIILLLMIIIFIINTIIYLITGYRPKKNKIKNNYNNNSNNLSLSNNIPMGFENPLDVAYMTKKDIEYSDFTAVLIYLANNGYIRFQNNKDRDESINDYNRDYQMNGKSSNFITKSITKSLILFLKRYKQYDIIKVKDYDGKDIILKQYMRLLFNYSYNMDKNIVHVDSLRYLFYKDAHNIIKLEKLKMKDKNLKFNNPIVNIVHIISIIALSILGYNLSGISNFLIFIMSLFLLTMISFAFYSVTYRKDNKRKVKDKSKASIIFAVILILIFSGPLLAILLGQFLLAFTVIFSSDSPLNLMISLSLILINISYIYKIKYTKEGMEIYNNIMKFKNYIEKGDINIIRSHAIQDNQYFWDILPYSYILYNDREWIDNYIKSGIKIAQPNWYEDINGDFKCNEITNSNNINYANNISDFDFENFYISIINANNAINEIRSKDRH